VKKELSNKKSCKARRGQEMGTHGGQILTPGILRWRWFYFLSYKRILRASKNSDVTGGKGQLELERERKKGRKRETERKKRRQRKPMRKNSITRTTLILH